MSSVQYFRYIVVYDPAAGFVTGGGWIDSPAGAYAADPSLTGKASFGFVARYRPGANVPDGNTEFQLQVAGLRFKSTSYEWLVVAGAKAMYKGVGTINGRGNYGFQLTAWDGQVNGGGGADRFRIRIWDNNQGESLVYDNQVGDSDPNAEPTTALGGGSIVVHKGKALQGEGLQNSGTTNTSRITPSQLQPLVTEAIVRWEASGLTAEQVEWLRSIPVNVADLGDQLLGLAHVDAIWIDDDAAGWGWYLDATPWDDVEYLRPHDSGQRNRIDLLSAVIHELGHTLGLNHEEHGVMGESLPAGLRNAAPRGTAVSHLAWAAHLPAIGFVPELPNGAKLPPHVQTPVRRSRGDVDGDLSENRTNQGAGRNLNSSQQAPPDKRDTYALLPSESHRKHRAAVDRFFSQIEDLWEDPLQVFDQPRF